MWQFVNLTNDHRQCLNYANETVVCLSCASGPEKQFLMRLELKIASLVTAVLKSFLL